MTITLALHLLHIWDAHGMQRGLNVFCAVQCTSTDFRWDVCFIVAELLVVTQVHRFAVCLCVWQQQISECGTTHNRFAPYFLGHTYSRTILWVRAQPPPYSIAQHIPKSHPCLCLDAPNILAAFAAHACAAFQICGSLHRRKLCCTVPKYVPTNVGRCCNTVAQS